MIETRNIILSQKFLKIFNIFIDLNIYFITSYQILELSMRVIGLIYFLFTLLLYITYTYGAQIQKGILPSTPIPFNPLHFGEKLFQQYLVDSFVRVERDRIAWIKVN